MNSKLTLGTLALVAALTGAPVAAAAPQTVPHMLLLVDRSGSMTGARTMGSGRRWESAYMFAHNDTTTQFFSNPDTMFSLASFNSNDGLMTHYAFGDFAGVSVAIDNLFAGTPTSGTPLANAACESVTDLFFACISCSQEERMLLIYSDGEHNTTGGTCHGTTDPPQSSCGSYAVGSWQRNVCDTLDGFGVTLVRHWRSLNFVPSDHDATLNAWVNLTGGAYTLILDNEDDTSISNDAVTDYLSTGRKIGTSYCGPAPSHSGGFPGIICGEGSTVVSDNDVTLVGDDLPPGTFAMFLTSQTQGFVANPGGSQGNLCLAGLIGRFSAPGQIQSADSTGKVSLAIDLGMLPTATGLVAVQPGETWHFQCWFRDGVGGVATSNLTDGLSIQFQ